MLRFVVLALAAVLLVEASSPGYGYRNNEYSVNAYNAQRQIHVNRVADHIGAGTGTADYHGVPGTSYGTHGHYGNGYGHGHAQGGYGYGRDFGHNYNQYGYNNHGVHGNRFVGY